MDECGLIDFFIIYLLCEVIKYFNIECKKDKGYCG